MLESRRQKRVASLIKSELSRLLIESVQTAGTGLITITRVEITKDLKTAYIYVSTIGSEPDETLITRLKEKTGYLRKSIASKLKLKYNPKLIFSLDSAPEHAQKIESLLEKLKDHEG